MVKYFSFLLFIGINSNLFSQIIDENYRLIYKAEHHIMKKEYDSALQSYNASYRIKALPKTSVQQYLTLLELDSNLGKIYFDTLLYYLASYSQHIERYGTYKIVEKAILENTVKKYALKSLEQNRNCSEFEGILADISRESFKINRTKNSKEFSTDTSFLTYDSFVYHRVCDLMVNERYKNCLDLFFENNTVQNICIDYIHVTKDRELNAILENLRSKNLIDKTRVGAFTDRYSIFDSLKKNSIFPEVYVFRNEVVYEVIRDTFLYNFIRADVYSIESIQNYIDKIIWQLEGGIMLWRLPNYTFLVYNENELDDAKEIHKLLSHPTKKYFVHKLKRKNSYRRAWR